MVINSLPENIDLSQYAGQWVIICENKVVAHDKNLLKIKEEMENCSQPILAKIPKKEILLF